MTSKQIRKHYIKAFHSVIFLCCLFLICLGTANAQWQVTNGPFGFNFIRAQCFAKQGTNLFAGTQGDGVWISTDNSASPWTKVSNGITNVTVNALWVKDNMLFAGTNGGVFVTTNSGTNWTAKNNGITNNSISSFEQSGANLFAATQGGGVFLSIDNGANWTEVNNGLTSLWVSALTVSGTNLFAGTNGFGGNGVYISTNNGANWSPANSGLNVNFVSALTVSGTNLFAVTADVLSTQVFISTNDGTNWSTANNSLPDSFEKCFAVSGTNVFAGAYSNGVYLTTNNGSDWIEVNEGFGSRTIRTLAVLGEDLFAGFYDGNVFRRPLSQMITSVEQISDLRPTDFILAQNYPNPFNPTTKISWQSPIGSWQALKVYDVLGNEVATLIDEWKEAGSYETSFNASSLSSGIYFYKLQIYPTEGRMESYNQTKKLILMK